MDDYGFDGDYGFDDSNFDGDGGYESEVGSEYANDKNFQNNSSIDEEWKADALNGGSGIGGKRATEGSAVGKNNNAAKNSSASSALKNVENAGASGGFGSRDAKDTENSGGNMNYTGGKALEAVAAKSMPGGKVAVNQVKKFGPFGIIILLLVSAMGLFAGSNSLAPFGFINNLMDEYNVFRTSMNKRSNVLMSRYIAGGKNTSILKTNLMGSSNFKIKTSMSNKLAKNGITYLDNADGSGLRLLFYEDPDTHVKLAVAANADDVGRIPSSLEINGEMVNVDSKLDFDSAIDMNDNFFSAEERSTRTLKGHIAGWFDTLSEKLHIRLGNSRNRQDYDGEEKTRQEVEDNQRKEGLADEAVESQSGTTEREPHEVTDYDDDGNVTGSHTEDQIEPAQADMSGTSLTTGMGEDSVRQSLGKRARAAAAQIGKISDLAELASIGCVIMKVINMVQQVVSALQKARILNYGTGIFEIIQGTMAGDSTNELHITMEKLFKKNENNESAWTSTAVTQTFAEDIKVDPNDPYAVQLNQDHIGYEAVKNTGWAGGVAAYIGALGGTLQAYDICVGIQITGAALGLVQDALEVVATVLTAGLFSFFSNLFSAIILKAALGVIMVGVGAFISQIAGYVAKMLATDFIGDEASPILGYVLDNAGQQYMQGQQGMHDGTPGNRTQVIAQWQQTQEVIASEARYIRETHSPFDPTSKYTFLGSIVNSLTPIATNLSAPLSVISNTVGLVGSSITNILPTAQAAGEASFKSSLNDDCPSLSAIGLVGDAYCNPYFVSGYTAEAYANVAATDVSALEIEGTYDKDPADVIDKAVYGNGGGLNLDIDNASDDVNNGNPEIIEHSELANWVVACPARNAKYGTADQSVIDYVKGSSTIKDMTTVLLSGVPFVGNTMDIIDGGKEIAHRDLIVGECNSEKYYKYAQYAADQAYLESAGIIEESAVTSFLNKYYEENPLDNSTEGIIARYSGLSYEKVDFVLGLVEYGEFVANYEPAEKGPHWTVKPVENYQYESDELIATSPIFAETRNIVYFDLRNRTKVA